MPTVLDLKQNQLLAALPAAELKRWLAQLESVDLPLDQVLYEPGNTLSHVYFPTTAIVSLLYVMENGSSAEIAVVGHEGIVGISLFMGGESTPSRALVQSAGRGFRLESQRMKDEFSRAGPVMQSPDWIRLGSGCASQKYRPLFCKAASSQPKPSAFATMRVEVSSKATKMPGSLHSRTP